MTQFQRAFLSCFVALGLFAGGQSAHATLVLSYDVNFVQTGPVTVGSTVDWELFVTVTGTPDVGSNFGIAQLSTDLTESQGEDLSPGTVGASFAGGNYDFSSGGTDSGTDLTLIGALDLMQGATTVGDSGDVGVPFLLASGSYTVTQVGTHTLQLSATVDPSLYFTAAGQLAAVASPYDTVNFGSDSIEVVLAAVPEPSSLAMMGLAACGGLGFVRRRRAKVL